MRPTILTLTAALALGGASLAVEPSDIRQIDAYPAKLSLKGADDSAQLIVTAKLADGRLHDLTGDITYSVADTKVARVTSTGRVVPVGDGGTTVTAAFGGKSIQVPVTATSVGENLPINFANQVVPVFTKLGCNSGGCHGKISGQNGFRLSLLGFEPELDYATLVKEDRGRRLVPAAPDQSLLLLKSTGTIAHGGGRKVEPNSPEYHVLRRWIAAGMPYGKDTDPVVTKITVYPEHRVMPRQGSQQVAVYAHYSDGSVEDVTRRTLFDSNDAEVAKPDGDAVVRTFGLSGEATVMARYQGHVTTFRATVPLGGSAPAWTFEPKTVVDQFTAAKWKELGLVPSKECSDEQFIRRAYLDLTGTLPTPTQLKAFLADQGAKKRDELIDRLVDTPEFSYYFANKWADVLRVKRRNQPVRAFGTFAFHDWIRDAIASDMPYDEFARAILGATGDETKNPPAVWYKELQTPEQFVDDTAQVFLGVRMACANCHHHPYEKWSQDDYWGLAAFFARVGRKTPPTPGQNVQNRQDQRQVIFTKATGTVTNKRTGKTALMKPPGGEPVRDDPDTDPRQKLVDWMASADNPFFAKAVANRYWAHFFGRGIVDPLDDMRATNPPSNPELLDALAKELVKNKYSLKSLVKVICKSRTYQLSSEPNEFNKHDKQAYARYYPKRMTAEVLFDAVCQVTGSPAQFPGMPSDRFAPGRAVMLPDESFASYFLDVFGRPQRISACECERVSEANLAQTLHLLNSDEVQGKLSRNGGRAEAMAKDARPDREKVEELFLWAVGHKPTEAQMKTALDHIAAGDQRKKLAYENILWALVNSKGFLFNQ